jgi:hypothetical protein
MAAKWVEKIKTKLAANPLYHNAGSGVTCLACLGPGMIMSHKVCLYEVTNYGKTFSVCCKCNTSYEW